MSEYIFNNETIKAAYDVRYQSDYMAEPSFIELVRVKSLMCHIPIDVKSILDYGCGQGAWSTTLTQRFITANIYGIDISNKAIQLAKNRHPNHSFSVFDGEVAPFDDKKFDVIFSFHVLEHVIDLERTADDMIRLLSEGGYLVVVCPCGNRGSFEERIVSCVKKGRIPSFSGWMRFFYEDAWHLQRLKSAELIGLFQQRNVHIFRHFYANQFFGALEWICKTGPRYVIEFSNPAKGINLSSKCMLLFYRVFLLILSFPLKIYVLNIFGKLRSDIGIFKKIVLGLLLPVKFIVFPIGVAVDLLAMLEWILIKNRKNGSEQFLIFRKPS